MTLGKLSSTVFRTFIIVLMLLLSACIIIPVPVPVIGETQDSYLQKEDIGFIEIRKSSRTDILAKLGSPTALSAEPPIWVYSIEQYLATAWDICAFVIFPLGVAMELGAVCPTESERSQKHSFLEVQFDDAGIVTGLNIDSLDDGACSKFGFCWDEQPTFLTANGSKVAPDWNCAVHLYTVGSPISAKLEIIGPKEFDLSLSKESFHIVLLQRWEPDIVILFDDGSRRRLPVACDTASAHFVQIDKAKSGYRVWQVPEVEGRKVVINKQSLLAVNFE